MPGVATGTGSPGVMRDRSGTNWVTDQRRRPVSARSGRMWYVPQGSLVAISTRSRRR
ncbi:hypothetical protein AB0I98_14210 [Streptomyces sp. NPDC050211]|uniref:hypothetical protein n=1 Tax=Streptomyces sp. NPDC050211 TaxID=3154932 RepID=UPI0034144185